MQNINCWNIYGGFMSRLFLKKVLFHSYSSYPASADDPLSICFFYWQLITVVKR